MNLTKQRESDSVRFNATTIFTDKKMNNLTAFQSMIFKVALDTMSLTDENYEAKIQILLKRISNYFNIDRTYLFFVNYEEKSMVCSQEWVNNVTEISGNLNKKICLKNYSWWVNQLIKNKPIYIKDVCAMPIEASVEQQKLMKRGVKSVLAIPLSIEGKVQAFIGLDSIESIENWTEESIEQIYIIGDILSKGITQVNNNKKINFLSYYDPLTDLPNRLLLTKKLKNDIYQSQHSEPFISIMFINLDGFKVINDNFGYDQGNALLKQVSERLVEIVNKNDIVSRTDSDQFILYISNYQNQENLDNISSQIIQAFNIPFVLRGEEYNITASMGVSCYLRDGTDVENLIRYAYMAMNKAKCLGKNQYQHCTTKIKEEALETITLTNDLYKAIERNQLLLHYQPKVKGLTGEIVGVEALLRWNHPELGFVPPFKFIPLAEKTQLILPIGYWVLDNAAKQLKVWQEKGYKPIKIAVNFSVYQLSHPRIIEQIEEILERHSLEAKYLEVEITESLAMDKNYKIKETLKKMKKMGITLSIDDFGKEYSSFNRLKESPMDAIKIDMSFVQGIGVSAEDEGIVRSVLSLADNLGLKTTAEGVETKEQAEFLNNTACDHLQGYYFHRPMEPVELENLLKI